MLHFVLVGVFSVRRRRRKTLGCISSVSSSSRDPSSEEDHDQETKKTKTINPFQCLWQRLAMKITLQWQKLEKEGTLKTIRGLISALSIKFPNAFATLKAGEGDFVSTLDLSELQDFYIRGEDRSVTRRGRDGKGVPDSAADPGEAEELSNWTPGSAADTVNHFD